MLYLIVEKQFEPHQTFEVTIQGNRPYTFHGSAAHGVLFGINLLLLAVVLEEMIR